MSAPVSIVIPTLNAQDTLLRILPQLVDGLMAGLIGEVIFADGGSTDQTHAIAEEAGAVIVSARKGRGTQMRAGGNAAKGTWIFFVHADTQLPTDWVSQFEAHITASPDRAAVFRLSFDARGPMARITAGWANLRTRIFDLPYGDQGLLIHGPLYRKIGGYDDIPLMEDVAIAKQLKGRITVLPSAVRTDAKKYERDGWVRRGWRNLTTLVLYKLGKTPEALVARYDRAHHKN